MELHDTIMMHNALWIPKNEFNESPRQRPLFDPWQSLTRSKFRGRSPAMTFLYTWPEQRLSRTFKQAQDGARFCKRCHAVSLFIWVPMGQPALAQLCTWCQKSIEAIGLRSLVSTVTMAQYLWKQTNTDLWEARQQTYSLATLEEAAWRKIRNKGNKPAAVRLTLTPGLLSANHL